MPPRIPIPRLALEAGGGMVAVAWPDGRVDRHPARDLRLACPCARCVDEGSRRPLLDPLTVAADLRAVATRPVGTYAAQIAFGDGHATGLYTYERLRALGTGSR